MIERNKGNNQKPVAFFAPTVTYAELPGARVVPQKVTVPAEFNP